MTTEPMFVPTPPHIVELDQLGDEIAELSAHLDAATARLLDLIRQFDARGGWNCGFRSCAHWLSWRVGLDLGAARERVRVARTLTTLPRMAQSLARGELSYAKVRALTRVATPETEERLLKVGRGEPAANVERIVRGWRKVDRKAATRECARQHAGRGLYVHHDEDGTLVLRGRLAPEVGALLLRALDAARETLYQRARPVDRTALDPSEEPTTPGPAAGRRAGAARRDGAASRTRPRRAGRALSGCGPRRCCNAGRPRSTRPIRAGRRGPRSRGNVPAPGVRREPCGHAPRR
jgi:hypothetical protein